MGHPEWADRSSKTKRQRRAESESESASSEEEDGGLLQRTGDLLKLRSDQLPRGTLDLKRMKDANRVKRAESVVRALEFHPTANVVLVAGFHKTLDLFQVDGQRNPKLQSVHVKDFPISTAHFTQDGTEVVMAGRKKRFFVYDMMAGKVSPVYGIRGKETSAGVAHSPMVCSINCVEHEQESHDQIYLCFLFKLLFVCNAI